MQEEDNKQIDFYAYVTQMDTSESSMKQKPTDHNSCSVHTNFGQKTAYSQTARSNYVCNNCFLFDLNECKFLLKLSTFDRIDNCCDISLVSGIVTELIWFFQMKFYDFIHSFASMFFRFTLSFFSEFMIVHASFIFRKKIYRITVFFCE